jgi:hypothetical protein
MTKSSHLHKGHTAQPVPTEKAVLVAVVDVAAGDGYALAMISVLVALLLTLRTWARSRAALQLEILALRH